MDQRYQQGHSDEAIVIGRADALADVAENHMNSEPVLNSTADRYQVIVHVRPEGTWSAETPYIDRGPNDSAETPNGWFAR